MNKRLLELAKQAGLKKEHGSDREYMGDFDWREYAELIVRDCVGVVKWAPTGVPHDTIIKNIKEYFGVE